VPRNGDLWTVADENGFETFHLHCVTSLNPSNYEFVL
jgi:hypothetical protein